MHQAQGDPKTIFQTIFIQVRNIVKAHHVHYKIFEMLSAEKGH